MKNLFFALLFLLPTLGFGQEVGEYYRSAGFGFPRYLTIMENNRFECKSMYCKSTEQGSGFYTIKKNILTLNYQTDSTKGGLPAHTKMDSTQSSTDSVKIKIKVRGRSEKDTLFFATIVFKNKKPVEGMMSDIDGNIEFSLTKSQDMCAFTLSMVGYANSEYSISSDKNYTITCFLEENGFDIFYKTGEIHKYHIRNIKKDSFELKNDYKDAKFEIYKRREKIEK